MGVRRIIKIFVFAALCVFASYSSMVDTQNRFKNNSEIAVAGNYKEAITKSINSAVRVVSSLGYHDSEDLTSTSSGTYFTSQGITYVLTAAHSIIGDCDTTVIIADEYVFNCIDLIYLEPNKDMAIMQVEEIFNRKPINIHNLLCADEEIAANTRMHEKLFYTGYPQGIGPLTFDGKIVSELQQNDIFFVHSYAWSGSSGSGVFNAQGRMVGIVTAVSVANTEYGVDVMEDLIIITSLSLSDLNNAL